MRSYSRPMLVSEMGRPEEVCSALEPLPLRIGEGGALYTERWLQNLIQRHPTLLPVEQIEPALTPLVPVCTELPLSSGYADNLMLTPDGGIVLVETKLWRNPEARREVVGQVLDYAKDLSNLSYQDLQAAVRKAAGDTSIDLFRLVHGADGPEEDEPRFIDAVARNLRLGRFLLIIAGDGIQQSAEQLAEFLQRHVGLHFTLSLVEISLWKVPVTGQVFVQPKVIARTVQIERAVVRLEAGVTAITAASIMPASPTSKPATLSDEQFYETLAQVDESLPERLKAFLTRAEALGIFPDIQRRLSLKWRSPEGQEFIVGGVDTQGRYLTDVAHYAIKSIGRLDLSHAFQRVIAELLPGSAIRQTPNPVGWRLLIDGKDPLVGLLLNNQEAWLSAMADYVAALEIAVTALEPA